MAAEDRDQIFEKALAKHVRAADPSRGADANALHTAGACPDAETLAAYHERSLSSEQTAMAKQHILACEHCQGILDQLAATDEIPLSVVTSAVATSAAPAQPAVASGVQMLKPRRVPLWAWVAPAGAFAAAVLVWVSVRENASVHRLPANEMAQTAAPAPAVPQMRAVPEAIAKAKPPNAAPLAAQLTPSPPRSDADKSLRRDSRAAYSDEASTFLPKGEASPAPRPSGGVAGERQETLREDLKSEEIELSRDIAAAEKKQKFDAATDTLNQVIPAEPRREQGAAIGGSLNRSATVDSAETTAKASHRRAAAAAQPAPGPTPAAPAASGAQQQEMEGMSRFKEAPGVLLANARGSSVISVPGGSAMWRIGSSGYIAHSSDGGKTWTPQASGVSASLVAGAAVSEQSCWIVGGAGTVLLTTDGGAHWQKLSAPTRDDLLSVSAIDARQATVTAAVGSYQTTDGGATWHKLGRE